MPVLTSKEGFTLGSSSPKIDVVKGWQFKNNNLSPFELSGLVPFVQLIGIYSESEINRLVTHGPDWDTQASRVVFITQGGQEQGLHEGVGDSRYMAVGEAATQEHEAFANKLKDKYIAINITDQNHRNTDTFVDGIVLATTAPQAGTRAYEYYTGTNMPKDSGGVGITDLQIETGTKDFMNRRYKMRLTVTDPQVLNDNPEYLKLTSLQSKFIIIHGWANLHEVGAPGNAPPTIENVGAPGAPNGRMYIDITQQNTGGMWSAAPVATTMFDFAFNEVGQLEASFTFMPREISFLATYTLPTISNTFRRFLGTGERTQVDPSAAERPPTQFAGFTAGLFAAGAEFGKNLADIIDEEQNNYNSTNPSLETVPGIFDFIDTAHGFNAADALRNWAEESVPFDGTTTALIDTQKQREGRNRFPYAGPGIRVYTKSRRRVADPESRLNMISEEEFNSFNREVDGEPAVYPEDMTEDERNQGTMLVNDYKTNIKYYYLGWLLEGVRFSLWDLNKTKAARGETPYNVRFRYMKIPQQSAFNASFQEELNTGLVPDVDKFVSESVAFMKSNCFPGYGMIDPRDLWAQNDKQRDGLTMRPMTEYDLNTAWPAAIEKEKAYMDEQTNAGVDLAPDDPLITSVYKDRLDARLNFYGIIGTMGEAEFKVGSDGKTEWDKMDAYQRRRKCDGGNWRHSLVVDPEHNNALRIMLPPYAGQLLYSYKHPAPSIGWTENNTESTSMYLSWRDAQAHETRVLGDTLGWYVKLWSDWGLMLLPEMSSPDSYGNRSPLLYGSNSNRGYVRSYHGDDQSPNYNPSHNNSPFNMVWTYRVKIYPHYDLNESSRNAATMSDRNRYVGDPTESREYGLLMPAQNARFYSGEYVATQRKWYNKHIQYLSNKFSKVIRQRITSAVSAGKTIEDIAAEPVDLYRLTGRVYWPYSYLDVWRHPGDPGGGPAGVLGITNENNPAERLALQQQAAIKMASAGQSQHRNIHSGYLEASSLDTQANWNIELNNANPYRLRAATAVEGRQYVVTQTAQAMATMLQRANDNAIVEIETETAGARRIGVAAEQGLYFVYQGSSNDVVMVYDNEAAARGDSQGQPLVFSLETQLENLNTDVYGYGGGMPEIPVFPPAFMTDHLTSQPRATGYGMNTSIGDLRDLQRDQDITELTESAFGPAYNYSDVDAELDETISQADEELLAEDNSNSILFGDGADKQIVHQLARRLAYMDRGDDGSRPLESIEKTETLYARALGSRDGLNAVLSFWNERLNKVLVDLYNGDLIDLPPESSIVIAGSSTFAAEISSGLARYFDYDNIARRERISTTSARTFSNLKSFEIKWANVKDVPEFIDIPQDAKTYDDLRDAGMGDGVTRGVMIDYGYGYNQKIDLNNIEAIADVGLPESSAKLSEDFEWPPDDVALQYAFLRYYQDPDRFLDGRKFREHYSSNGYGHQLLQLYTAKALVRYIAQKRNLIKTYLIYIRDTEAQISESSARRNNIIRIRDEAIQAKEQNALTAKIVSYFPREVSPFTGALPGDQNFILHKGGGRKVELNSQVALQWEQRFRRWECRGVPDIMNYGPKKGGVPYQDKKERYWGWHTDNSKNRNEELSKLAAIKGRANLGDWNYPKSILNINALRHEDTYEWHAPWTYGTGQFNIAGGASNLYDEANWRKGSLHPYMHIDYINGEESTVQNDFVTGNSGARVRSFILSDGQPNILIDADELINGNIVWIGTDHAWGGAPSSNKNQRWQPWKYTTPIRIKHLVRSGLVDVDLINEILSAKYGWSSIGFEKSLSDHDRNLSVWSTSEYKKYMQLLDEYQAANVAADAAGDEYIPFATSAARNYYKSVVTKGHPEKVMLGYWPLAAPFLSLDEWQNGVSPTEANGTIEPYYLVDQDLDFVEPAYRQAEGPEAFQGIGAGEGYEHLIGLQPTDWVKVNRADCLFAPEINYHLVMYPQSVGYRIGVDEHIPGLPEEAVRQLVNVPGRKAEDPAPPESFSKASFAKYGDNRISGAERWVGRGIAEWAWYSAESFVPEFGSNPSISNVPKLAMKKPNRRHSNLTTWSPSIASLKGTFTSQGYVAYNAIFPYGIPYLSADWNVPIGYPTAGGMQQASVGWTHHSQYYPYPVGQRARTLHETLHNLPFSFEDGFFSSVVGAGADFSGGAPLNESLADFIAEHIFSLLPGGRQVGIHDSISRWDREPTNDSLHQYDGHIIRDVTYGDLLDSVLNNRETTTANFTTQRIESVAEIPIKREVIDNLLKPNNANTSLLRFFQQIMAPSAIGLPGNVQLGVRNNNGLIEIFPASISYRGQTSDMFREAAEAEERQGQPENQLLFNYKLKNSLIENIDMSSKMDPAAFLTYQNSSDLLRGRDFNVLKLLSYEGVALEFKQFLEGTLNVDGSGETYSGIISSDPSRKIKIDKVRYDSLPSSVLDAFVAQDPERWAKITATMQGQENFTTELLAFYMRGVTLIVHGITNLQPFNLIHITGVLPDLEGIYIITNLTEKVTPTTFQTIIEGKLLKRKRISEDKFI